MFKKNHYPGTTDSKQGIVIDITVMTFINYFTPFVVTLYFQNALERAANNDSCKLDKYELVVDRIGIIMTLLQNFFLAHCF